LQEIQVFEIAFLLDRFFKKCSKVVAEVDVHWIIAWPLKPGLTFPADATARPAKIFQKDKA
jgi:hypothetical protein